MEEKNDRRIGQVPAKRCISELIVLQVGRFPGIDAQLLMNTGRA